MNFCTSTYFLLVLVPLCSTKSKLDDRIVNGQPAAAGQFPYQVSLKANHEHFCGGSVISGRWVLTAAHCLNVYPSNDITVNVGSETLDTFEDVYGVQKQIAHPQYTTPTHINDIGLIRTTSYIWHFSNNVQLIKLATVLPTDNSDCVVSGWGYTVYQGPDPPNHLQYLNTTYIDWEDCRQKVLNASYILHPSQICTFVGGNKSFCNGDSGGPLVANGMQFGVVSLGAKCAGEVPDIYANVVSFNGWINSYADTGY